MWSKRVRDRSGAGRAGRSSRSFERPPRGKRQGADGLDAERFVFHGKFADEPVGVIEAELERVGLRARTQVGVQPREALLTRPPSVQWAGPARG